MKGFLECLLVVLSLLGICSGFNCTVIPGNLVQIDAGNGQVFGVNKTGHVFTWYRNSLQEVPGVSLTHVTVGPAGVWGVNKDNHVYRLVWGDWVKTTGSLRQVDSGGNQIVSGVNSHQNVYCLNRSAAVLADGNSPLPWTHIEGKMTYYTCGPLGCWGVNGTHHIFYRRGVSPGCCAGSGWQEVAGRIGKLEIGADGTAYGLTYEGRIYRRDGITPCNPIGTHWVLLEIGKGHGKLKYISYDLNVVWILDHTGKILKCRE